MQNEKDFSFRFERVMTSLPQLKIYGEYRRDDRFLCLGYSAASTIRGRNEPHWSTRICNVGNKVLTKLYPVRFLKLVYNSTILSKG